MKFCPHLPHSVSEVDRIRHGRCPQRYWVILSVEKIGTVKATLLQLCMLACISFLRHKNQTEYVSREAHNWFIFYAFGPICAGLLRSFYPDIAPATQHCITCSGLKPTTLTNYIHYSKLYIILTSDIYGLHCILFNFVSFYDIILRKIPANNYIDFNIVE
jgi:hypothetical protein